MSRSTSAAAASSTAPSSVLWRTATDPASGRLYYYHVETRQTQWRKPLELATAEERRLLAEKDAQQRAFFQAMEQNILQGLAAQTSPVEGTRLTTGHERWADDPRPMKDTLPPGMPRPSALRVRTISTMDVTVLRDLIGNLPSNNSNHPGPTSGRMEQELLESSQLGQSSQLLSIVEHSPDGDEEQDDAEEVRRSQAVVQEFFESLQQVSSDDSPTEPTGSGTPGGNHRLVETEDPLCDQSESEFSVSSRPDLIRNRYMPSEPTRPRHPHALSKDQASVASNTSNTSLSISALGVSDRQLSSDSMTVVSGILEEGGLSILDEEEVMALRQLASAANQMLRLTEDDDDLAQDSSEDSLCGLHLSSDDVVEVDPPSREISTVTDDGLANQSLGISLEDATIHSCASLPIPKPVSLAGSPPSRFPTRPNMLCHRRNTCGTIYVSSTLSDPDKDATIMCVCAVYRTHVLQSTMDHGDDDAYAASEEYAVFNDLAVLQRRKSRVEFQNALPLGPPSLEEVSSFYRDVFRRAKMEADCIIMSLIYVERLIKKTHGKLRPRPENWRSILFACMVLSSKVWDDMSMWNADFSQTCPAGIRFPLQRINQLEVAVLSCLDYNVKVKAGEYAKYYFLLRTMLIKSGLGGHDLKSMLPLDVEGAKRLQQVSSQYQTAKSLSEQFRSKSMSAITMATPGSPSDSKAFPKAGLEQLVKM